MHIDALWVDEQHRACGYVSTLMKAIEDYAAAHAHPLMYLETTSFQALPFYEGLGYRTFGELPRISEGQHLFFDEGIEIFTLKREIRWWRSSA